MVSLYRKYRPHTFDDLVDQEVAKRALRNSVASGNVSHAYLFCGPRGTGKTSTARILARALVCDAPVDGNPCGTCGVCLESAELQLIDIIEIDAASNRGIDEIRALREKISFAPTRAKKKVYIIDEVHMLTKDAFNALLKTLEEPPAHAHFILATTEIHKVIDTIISRCQRYDFRRITTDGIVQRLQTIVEKEGFTFAAESLALIAESANGGLRDAIRSLEQLEQTGTTDADVVRSFLGMAGSLRVRELVDHLMEQHLQDALAIVQELYSQGVHMRELAKETVLEIRSRMMADIQKGAMDHVRSYMNMIEAFEKAKVQLAQTLIEQLPLEIACVRSCEQLLPTVTRSVAPATPTPPSVPVQTSVVKKVVAPTAPATTPAKPTPVPPVLEEAPAREAPVEQPRASILDDVIGTGLFEAAAQSSVSSSSEEVSCSLEHVQQEWKNFCATITKSSVKFCMKEGRPMRLDGLTLLVRFPTQFSMDKVMEAANRDVVHSALKSFFHTSFELSGEVSGDSPLPTIEEPSAGSTDVLSVFEGSEFL